MVGGANSSLESNPIPIRDAQRAQTNLVCTRTQGPHRDWDRTPCPHRVPFIPHNAPAILCEHHPLYLPTAALMQSYIQLAGWGEGNFLKSWTQGFPSLVSSHPVPILPTVSGQPLSWATSILGLLFLPDQVHLLRVKTYLSLGNVHDTMHPRAQVELSLLFMGGHL